MSDEVYTLGAWWVKDGKQCEFVEAWKELSRHFGSLPHPPGTGTLLQNLDEPRQFHPFGPWRIGRLMDLCDEGRPGTFRVVATG